MRLSFDLINSFLVHPFKGVDDPKLHKNLALISQNFTQDRSKINQYVETDELVSAYTAFYFPTNFIKLKKIFELLPKNVVESLLDYDVIDVGSGPGTYAAAFLDYFPSFQNQLYLIESSKMMCEQAKKTLTYLFPNFTKLKINQQISGDKKRLILFGNSLNEIGHAQALNLIESNKASVVIFIEPGTPQVFQEILPLREKLLNKKFNILYPCPSSADCPIKDDKSNWCHQIFHEVHEQSIETLSQYIQKDRRTLPVIAHVYGKEFSSEKKQNAVIFRVFAPTKFSFNFEICEGEKIQKIEVMKKDYSKDQQKIIEQMLAGMPIKFSVQKTFDQFSRVTLSLA